MLASPHPHVFAHELFEAVNVVKIDILDLLHFGRSSIVSGQPVERRQLVRVM
jgi:hypothetical protein